MPVNLVSFVNSGILLSVIALVSHAVGIKPIALFAILLCAAAIILLLRYAVPHCRRHISSTAGGYHIEDISPVPQGTDIIEKSTLPKQVLFSSRRSLVYHPFAERYITNSARNCISSTQRVVSHQAAGNARCRVMIYNNGEAVVGDIHALRRDDIPSLRLG